MAASADLDIIMKTNCKQLYSFCAAALIALNPIADDIFGIESQEVQDFLNERVVGCYYAGMLVSDGEKWIYRLDILGKVDIDETETLLKSLGFNAPEKLDILLFLHKKPIIGVNGIEIQHSFINSDVLTTFSKNNIKYFMLENTPVESSVIEDLLKDQFSSPTIRLTK